MPDTINTYFEKWNADQKLSFIEFFTHELTLCIRSIWADEILTSLNKVEQIKWINEIILHMPMIAYALRMGKETWNGSDVACIIEKYLTQDNRIRSLVESAIEYSIQHVTGEYK